MVKKHQLFEDDEKATSSAPASGTEMKINKNFADKYEQREKKKLLAKSKDLEVEEESSEYSDEDSDAVLINDKVEQKFLETIARIRANDPKLKDQKEDLFKDDDFEIENIKEKAPEEKPVTFKSMMAEKVKKKFGQNLEKNINEISDNDSENEDEFQKETDVQMQKRLKAEFIDAAHSEPDSDSDILQVKEKTKAEVQKEKEDFEKFAQEAAQKKFDEDQFLKEFWGKRADARLSAEDKFLRNYILGEKWKETNQEIDEAVDEEDFDRESEMEEFEENYNFRFEERDGDKIRTYPRTIEDTYRIARNKRMEKKIEKKKRLKAYLKEKKQEREQIFALKRSEILEKIKEAEFIAGSESIGKKIAKELETEFDPDLYDKIMSKAFDDEYYNQEDEKEKVFEKTVVDDYAEVVRYDDKPKDESEDKEMEGEGEGDNEVQENKGISNEKQQPVLKDEQLKHLKKKTEVKQAFKQLEEEGDYDIWYACDGCIKPIKPGKFRFDCKICDNFTFCQTCFRNNETHVHPFKKKKVPLSLAPPEENEVLLSKAYLLCKHCRKSLLDKSRRVFECKTWECYICKDCKDTHTAEESETGHEVVKVKNFEERENIGEGKDEEEKEKDKKEYLDGLLEEYYNLGFEDIIGKDLYTRFKYTKVKKNTFGLTDEEILLLNDKELNQLVSLKKYKPYRNDEDRVNLHKINNIKRKFTKRIEEEKKQLKQVMKHDINIQKEKLLGIKTDAKDLKKQLVREAKKRDRVHDIILTKEENKNKKWAKTQEVQEVPTSAKKDRRSLYKL